MHEDEVERELQSIYNDPERTEEDLTTFSRTSMSPKKKILIGLIVFLAIIAAISWAGFFFFSSDKAKFSGEEVMLAIDGPEQIKSGALTIYTLHYKNQEKIPLGTASIEVRFPKSFHLQKTDPAAENNVWQIGSVASGKEGNITVQGIFIAPIDKELDIQAILTYRPADFNAEFQKVATRTVKVNDSVMELTVSGPAKVLPGDKVTLHFNYHNASQNTFENFKFLFVLPEKFIPESADPAPINETYQEWLIPKLGPDKTGSIAITGTFAAEVEGKIDFKGKIGFLGENDVFALQKEAVYTADVFKGDLVSALILNGKAENQAIRFGDVLRYTLTYRNTGTVTLENVSLSLVFETTPPDKLLLWNALKDRGRGIQKNNQITWTKKQIPSLTKIAAGEEGTLDITIPVIDAPISGLTDTQYQISSWVEATVNTIDGEKVSRTTKTPPLIAKINSDTTLSTEAMYFNQDNIPVGSGPLPPTIGQATSYRVTWKIENSLHELTDLKISAKLPPNVVWHNTSSVDAGNLRFDAPTEKMVWTLNWLPRTIKTLTINFNVDITPTPEQKNQIPMLTDTIIFEAIDKITGSSVLLSQDPLTTSLEHDISAAGKGRVQ